MKKPLLLMILDGFGLGPKTEGNAIAGARTPNLDSLLASCPHTSLGASGLDVGLPRGQMGNSEVGHTNIGAGRIVYQELTRITKSIEDGTFYENPVLLEAVGHCKVQNKSLHFMGLLSPGGVHSHRDHLIALVELAKRQGLDKVYIHCFMDGRDVPPTSGLDEILWLQKELNRLGTGRIATVSGRFYAMDRDNRWERISQAYAAMVDGEGVLSPDPAVGVGQSYEKGVTDEFIQPMVCDPAGMVQPGDGMVFFNFRPDRAREITRAFVDPTFEGFGRKRGLLGVNFVCMTQYDAAMPGVQVAFLPQSLSHTLGQVLADNGLTQLRIAETEKYAHVTLFFNGGTETVYPGEDRVLIPSPKVATYDLKPEMSAYEVAKETISRLESGKYDVVVLNFANCDMVGHTGVYPAAVTAVEAVDFCVGRVVEQVRKQDGVALITADHGNADQMLDENQAPFTAHTTNPVPFVVVGLDCTLRESGVLADIAPTVLEILGLPQPVEMSGKSLLKK